MYLLGILSILCGSFPCLDRFRWNSIFSSLKLTTWLLGQVSQINSQRHSVTKHSRCKFYLQCVTSLNHPLNSFSSLVIFFPLYWVHVFKSRNRKNRQEIYNKLAEKPCIQTYLLKGWYICFIITALHFNAS